MCGIAGILNIDGAPVNEGKLNVLNQFLQERGPDHTGNFVDGNVGLTHTRLSIIDLATVAHQPMASEDGNVVIAFNGEIYNFQQIKQELSAYSISYKTTSDTEVLLYAYYHWGIEKTLRKLEGMFAFAIYDKRDNSIVLARDRFGQKPLYIYNKEQFIFSSDISSIWKSVSDLTLDEESMDHFISEFAVPQPKSIWNEISQLPPAHYMTVDVGGGYTTTEKYWSIDYSVKTLMTEEEAIAETEKRVVDAVMKRTMSDVPLGAFLSGGVDSGLIVSILASNSSEKVKTFSVGLTYDEVNELPEARLIADKYQTDHTEIIAEANVIEHLPDMLKYIGEPFGDSSIIPSYLITKEIRKNVTVALSGDGGDELFGGYYNYAEAYKTDQFLDQYPESTARKIQTIIGKIKSRMNPSLDNPGSFEAYHKSEDWQKLYRLMGTNPNNKSKLYKGSLKKHANFTKRYFNTVWDKHRYKNYTDTLFHSSFETRLLNDYLVKVDRSSMRNSLEVRSPFMDHSLAAFSATIPNKVKFGEVGHTKFLLKKLAQKYMDPNIFERKKKGFGIPIHHWLKNELNTYMKDLLLGQSIQQRGHFNGDYIQKIINEHESGKANNAHEIWTLMCLEIWMQEYFDKKA